MQIRNRVNDFGIRLVQLAALAARLSLRERVMIFIGALILLLALWDGTVVRALDQRRIRASQQLAQLVASGDETSGEASSANDLQRLNQQVQSLDLQVADDARKLRASTAAWVEPLRMPQMLQAVLEERTSLKLKRLANLPAEPIEDNTATESDGVPRAVAYLHAVEIIVDGRFTEVYDYLSALEHQPWHLLWRTVELEKSGAETVKARIVVATISVDRDWIRL
jgi:MSHA biogenesis protein MshJ